MKPRQPVDGRKETREVPVQKRKYFRVEATDSYLVFHPTDGPAFHVLLNYAAGASELAHALKLICEQRTADACEDIARTALASVEGES